MRQNYFKILQLFVIHFYQIYVMMVLHAINATEFTCSCSIEGDERL